MSRKLGKVMKPFEKYKGYKFKQVAFERPARSIVLKELNKRRFD